MTPVPDFSTQAWEKERPHRWELINNIAAWAIWRARYTHVFEGRVAPPAETVRDFWSELIHTLRGQFEQLVGCSDRMPRLCDAFLRLWWREGPFFIEAGSLCWQYRPPIWLLPPLTPNHIRLLR